MLSRKRTLRSSECWSHVIPEENDLDSSFFSGRFSRKRKRRESDSDSLSVHSLDVSFKEPARRKKRLSRVTSLATIFSPVRPVMKVGEALQRSWSGVKISSPVLINKKCSADNQTPHLSASPMSSSTSSSSSSSCSSSPTSSCLASGAFKSGGRIGRKSQATPVRQRQSRLWTEMVGNASTSRQLTDHEIRRQEAIFELYQGEEDMVEDLHLVKSTYHDSLLHLNIMTNEELQQIFSSLHILEPLHHELVVEMKKLRDANGVTNSVGNVLVNWIPRLYEYVAYCANQVYAKAMLDEKKVNDRRVEDFLQRCLESPFSRKLDLWNFLDVPRNRLVKYPLIFKNILKLTPQDHEDVESLKTAIELIEQLIGTVDKRMGESECRFFINKLDFLDENQKNPLIGQSTCLMCRGILRNNRGTKLNAFLFDRAFVLTRPVTRGDRGRVYQVYRQPIGDSELVIEDVKDGETKMGSFRSAFTHGQAVKNVLRVSSTNLVNGHSHTLQAIDEHDKKQWIQNLRRVSKAEKNSANVLRTWNRNKGSPAMSKRTSSTSSLNGSEVKMLKRNESAIMKEV